MAHGHDVLHMMEGNSYETKEDLVKAIIEHFGEEERFSYLFCRRNER